MPSLTPDEFRSLAPGTAAISDEGLAIILAGTWAAIEQICGPEGDVAEIRVGGLSYVILARRVSDPGDIATVKERDSAGNEVTLADDDWELRGNGTALLRLSTGTNPAHYWDGTVLVDYTSADDEAVRQLAQAELTKLEIVSNPGLAMQVVGNWTIQFQQGKSYGDIRADILATLTPAGPVWA